MTTAHYRIPATHITILPVGAGLVCQTPGCAAEAMSALEIVWASAGTTLDFYCDPHVAHVIAREATPVTRYPDDESRGGAGMTTHRLLATAAVALAAASALLLPALGSDAPVRVTFEDGSVCEPADRCWDAVQAGTFYAPEVTR